MPNYEVHYKDKLNKTWDVWYESAGTTLDEAEQTKQRVEAIESTYDVEIKEIEEDELCRYAIAICTGTDNKVIIVESDNPVNAIKLGVEENLEFDQYNTVEEALQYYFDGDIIISEPIKI